MLLHVEEITATAKKIWKSVDSALERGKNLQWSIHTYKAQYNPTSEWYALCWSTDVCLQSKCFYKWMKKYQSNRKELLKDWRLDTRKRQQSTTIHSFTLAKLNRIDNWVIHAPPIHQCVPLKQDASNCGGKIWEQRKVIMKAWRFESPRERQLSTV